MLWTGHDAYEASIKTRAPSVLWTRGCSRCSVCLAFRILPLARLHYDRQASSSGAQKQLTRDPTYAECRTISSQSLQHAAAQQKDVQQC